MPFRLRLFGKQAEALPFRVADRFHSLLEVHDECVPGADLILVKDLLGSERIVQIQNAGLRKNVRGAEACWMSGVTLNLGRPS